MHSVFRFLTALVCFFPTLTSAQIFDEQFDHWPVNLKINGRIIIAAELKDLAAVKQAVPESAIEKPTTILVDECANNELRDSLRSIFGDNEDVDLVVSNGKSSQFESILAESEFVLWHSVQPVSAAVRTAVGDARAAFTKHINDGRILAIIGTPAELVSEFYIATDSIRPPQLTGLNLMPDCVIETGFTDLPTDRNRLLSVLAAHPRCVGVGLEKDTVLVLSGRKMRVVGGGTARFFLMANEREPIRTATIRPGRSRNPEDTQLDLTQWRRDAIDRTLAPFPPAEPKTPCVDNGALMIVGGGGMPEGLMHRMIDLAGGVDDARLVYVPCSESDDVGETQRTVESWKKMGVKHATFIHTKDRNKANTDEAFLEPLKAATGIWFGGGRQWNFADSYYGTQTHKLMKVVLKRGGVIGGSSAGASIQARYLARATPIQNFKIMAFGYERGGLGFISGVAIDQHFSQRGRQKDMTRLVNKYPQLLGIGIDEGTAIIVQKSKATVVGKGKVHFYDRNLPVYPDQPDYVALPRGSAYDLAERRVLIDGAKASGAADTNQEKQDNASDAQAPELFKQSTYSATNNPRQLRGPATNRHRPARHH